MALLTCGRTVKAQIIYPSDQVTLDNTNIIYILEGKADKEHTHDAGDITTGQLDNAVFDAYGNLEAKDKIGAGANQAARGNHTHDISLLTGMLPVTMYNAYSNLVSLGRIGTSFDQVARGDHSHPSYAQGIFNLGERVNAIELSRGATNIVAGDADSYNHTTRTLMWNTNAVEDTGATYIQFGDYWQFELNLKAGHWTDFEIKASTNNFDSLCYYYKSWTTQDATRGDTNAYVWFTDDYSDDVRVWRKKDHDKSISQMLVSTNSVVETVIFQPSHESEIDWASWMFDERLVWSFVRVDDIGFEMNASGTKQRWSPVTGKRGNLFKP